MAFFVDFLDVSNFAMHEAQRRRYLRSSGFRCYELRLKYHCLGMHFSRFTFVTRYFANTHVMRWSFPLQRFGSRP